MLEIEPFPGDVLALIDGNLARSGGSNDCLACSGGCCAVSGFALIQNVALAYQEYASGRLNFQFEPGLSAQQFLHTYYDVVQVAPGECPGLAGPLLVFFPCSVVRGTTLTHVTPLDGDRPREERPFALHEYHAAREAARARLPYDWHCVFWNGGLPLPGGGGRTFGGCVLHGKQSATHLTAKPVDCVHGACRTPPELARPGLEEVNRWLLALSRHYLRTG